MAGEFTSSYQRTKYWLDLLWPEHKKRQQQEQAEQEQAEQEQAEQEQQQDPSRLKEADFEGGFRMRLPRTAHTRSSSTQRGVT